LPRVIIQETWVFFLLEFVTVLRVPVGIRNAQSFYLSVLSNNIVVYFWNLAIVLCLALFYLFLEGLYLCIFLLDCAEDDRSDDLELSLGLIDAYFELTNNFEDEFC
jgi:hypothetical protein